MNNSNNTPKEYNITPAMIEQHHKAMLELCKESFSAYTWPCEDIKQDKQSEVDKSI